MEKEIITRIKPTGEVEIETKGYRGRSCLEATKDLETALGKVGERELKPEFRQEENVASRHQARR
jgi:hypothetical protein